ncbi:hypothetical protein C3941_03890 [Kaistia algarum]|uniref:sulfotransferase n=1 Tax=Kaistia algarum TaxID=2083279 RepID=UPI000CE8FF6B|nr:sulfotransferase [Kaistia algarum]MCX5512644.1 sulfotransferase [Kaistia algarum]PPE81842.1 hypothetical protein C3941_03890 [Kaistia algarum]
MRLIEISAWNDSGGGFLHRLFDGHPGLDIWPFELLLGADGEAVDRLSPDWFHGRFRWPRLAHFLEQGRAEAAFDAISDRELKAVLTDPDRAKHRDYPVRVALDDWRRATAERWRAGADRSQAAFIEAYIETFLRLSGAPSGWRPVLGHCPVIIIDAGRLFADFPDARILHVVRDPLAGFADMRRRHPGLDAASYARKWSLVNMAAALAFAKAPSQVEIATFSSLLAERRTTMERLCRFLDLSFDEALLRPSWRGVALDESDMGPFGGVPAIGLDRERQLAAALSEADRKPIETLTVGTAAVLARFGVL